jgi:hypothetical protein
LLLRSSLLLLLWQPWKQLTRHGQQQQQEQQQEPRLHRQRLVMRLLL